ncbi:hypothetical protein [Succinimonas sp.]|uniref:hypothetical protein n=1 Tax=Succinimonas sp. TaxID=1936151 RepID=UPI003864ADD0
MAMPKVISLFQQKCFEDLFPEIPILGEPTNLFVECLSYDIQIPCAGMQIRSLDMFEEAVLRMVPLKGSCTNDLADILCIGEDFVWFIMNRLMEKGLLDKKLELTGKGSSYLNLRNEQKTEIETVQGRVFMLKKTGQILPFIHIGEFQSEKINEMSGKHIVLSYGSTGNSRKVVGLRLRNTDYEIRQDSYLPDKLLRNAILRFNRLNNHKEQKQIALWPRDRIDSSKSEPVYFHIQAVIQDGNSDEILFSDGFVSNIDWMMEYVKGYPDVISEIQKRAVRMTVITKEEESQRPPVRQKYWEIIQNYNTVQRYLVDAAKEDVTPDQLKEIDKNKRQVVIDCYHILETALLYYLKEHPVSDTIMNVLRRQTADQNKQTVLMMAGNLGILQPLDAGRLLSHLNGNQISSVFNTGTAHMHICLPLAIAEANESPQSRILILIREDNRFLEFLQYLSDVSAAFRHDADAVGYNVDMKDIAEKTTNIVRILLPGIQLDDDNVQISNTGNVSQARLLAQISLSKAFGSIVFQTMSDGLKGEWMRISPDKKGKTLPEMSEYAQILYRIFQTTLTNANQEFPMRNSITRNEAIQRLIRLYGKPLPKSIVSVSDVYYESAVQGRNSTLGAEALIYAANRDGMDALIKAGFVQSVDKILKLRGHGSQIASLTENEHTMGALRDNVIKLTNMIIGG